MFRLSTRTEMQLKTDDSFNRRSVILMLGSVVLFAANTLLIRAIAIHTPAADGWVAILRRTRKIGPVAKL